MALTEVDAARLNDNVFNATGPYTNRIINGDMRIDQRNAGAAVTLGAGFAYTLDRWGGSEDTDGAATVIQDSSAPTGFTKSLKYTTTTADASLGAAQFTYVAQWIEGQNVDDLAWGTASAKAVTLSFWVRSSLTGTFGGAITNSAFNRSYAFTYSISTADTWEYKTVTIPGDTTGTWLTTNGVGIRVQFGLGVGSTYSGTAGSWAAAQYFTATGATSVIGTLNATFYITGVQLEAGSVATPFERRSYGQELALCQRYYQKSYSQSVVPGSVAQAGATMAHIPAVGNTFRYTLRYVVPMRSSPNATFYNPETGTIGFGAYEGSGNTNAESISATFANENSVLLFNSAMDYTGSFYWHHVLSAEL